MRIDASAYDWLFALSLVVFFGSVITVGATILNRQGEPHFITKIALILTLAALIMMFALVQAKRQLEDKLIAEHSHRSLPAQIAVVKVEK